MLLLEKLENIRQILGSFLFSGDDIEKKVQVLSGGEKTRLSLWGYCFSPIILILDEPTNHLDMISKEILKDALAGYAETLLLVSHDRGFLDGLTDRVYFIKDKTIKVYHEPVTQFISSYYNDITDQEKTNKPEKSLPKNKKHQNQQSHWRERLQN